MYVRAAFSLMLVVLLAAPVRAAVHSGDQLFVTVYDHPELTGPVTVDTTERISLPLAGLVDVRGLGARQIADRIQQQLAVYVRKPAVNVQLKTQQFMIFIAGGPGGTLKYEAGETLVAALGDLAPRLQEIPANDGTLKTGDLSQLERSRLDMRRVGIVRDDKSVGTFDVTRLSATGQSGPVLQPGDTLVFVNKPNAVRVMGDVARPGLALLSEDEPLSDAVAQVGGELPSAATSNIVLQRGGQAQNLALGDPKFDQPAQNGDVLTVPSAPRVNIVGLVDKPGAVILRTDISLLSALYEAGGPTKWADLTQVQVVQDGAKKQYDITRLVHGDTSQNPQLKDGDVVFVPEGHKIAFGEIFQNILSAAFFVR
jgi:protein involved in polysaccharide export with SLBB domain